MLNIVYGALGMILVLLLFAAGMYVGYKLHAHRAEDEAAKARKPETPAEAERRRLIEDQTAFRQMMGYSAEVAYGITSTKDFEVEDGET